MKNKYWMILLIIVISLSILVYIVSLFKTPYLTNMNNTQQNNLPMNNANKSSQVVISNFSFNPSTVTIKTNSTITWVNNDSTPHTVASDNGIFSSNPLQQGETYSYTFPNKGTFAYHCSIHPSMHGTIIVNN